MISIKKNDEIELDIPSFLCDNNAVGSHLDGHPLTQLLNIYGLWGVYDDYTPHKRTTTTSTGGGEPKPPTVEYRSLLFVELNINIIKHCFRYLVLVVL